MLASNARQAMTCRGLTHWPWRKLRAAHAQAIQRHVPQVGMPIEAGLPQARISSCHGFVAAHSLGRDQPPQLPLLKNLAVRLECKLLRALLLRLQAFAHCAERLQHKVGA